MGLHTPLCQHGPSQNMPDSHIPSIPTMQTWALPSQLPIFFTFCMAKSAMHGLSKVLSVQVQTGEKSSGHIIAGMMQVPCVLVLHPSILQKLSGGQLLSLSVHAMPRSTGWVGSPASGVGGGVSGVGVLTSGFVCPLSGMDTPLSGTVAESGAAVSVGVVSVGAGSLSELPPHADRKMNVVTTVIQ